MADRRNKQAEPLKGAPPLTSGVVMSFPTPPARKAEEYLNAYSGYAYTAISAIAQEVASIELKLYSIKYMKDGSAETDEINQHDILSFLGYLNPLMTFYDMAEATQTYLELVGEAFWVLLKDGSSKTPKEAYLLRPDWVSIVPSKEKIIDHYLYKPGGLETEKIIIPRENMIHFKYFNPTNPYRGKGSIQAAAMPLDIHSFAQEWNRNFFFNSATPGLIFTTEKKLDDKSVRRFIEQWRATHEGRSKAHKVAFLGGGFKMEKTSLDAKELDFAEMQKQMRDDILAVFKVPKTVLGLTEDVNRANAEATTRAFMERVITPRMKKFVNALNEFLVPMFTDKDLFLDFTDPSPEDTEQAFKRYESGRKYGWLTANEIRDEENLEPVEGGDVLEIIGGTPTPVGTPPSNTKPEDQEDQSDEDSEDMMDEEDMPEDEKPKGEKKPKEKKPKKMIKHMVIIPKKRPEVMVHEELEDLLTKQITKMIGDMLVHRDYSKKIKEVEVEDQKPEGTNKYALNGEAREVYWRKLIDKTDKWEDQISKIALNVFSEQEKIVLGNIAGAKDWRVGQRKGKESSFLQSLSEMAKGWLLNLVPFLRELVLDQGTAVLDYLGVGGNLDLGTPEVQEYLNDNMAELIQSIDETTREKLKVTLAEGFGLGESVAVLSNRVEDVFASAKTSRAKIIARSEALRASNFATDQAYKQSGFVTGKEWLTSPDEKTCPFCAELDGKIVDVDDVYFEKGSTFRVKDEKGKTVKLKFDLLEVGYPPLHPNCRCTLIPVVLEKSAPIPEKKAKPIKKKEDPQILKVIAEALNEEVESIKSDLQTKSNEFLAKKEKELQSKYEVETEVNLENANEMGILLVKEAGVKADEIIEEAKAKSKKAKLSRIAKREKIKEAEELAKAVIKEAKKEAKQIKENARKEAESEKESMLKELKTLREDVKKAILG